MMPGFPPGAPGQRKLFEPGEDSGGNEQGEDPNFFGRDGKGDPSAGPAGMRFPQVMHFGGPHGAHVQMARGVGDSMPGLRSTQSGMAGRGGGLGAIGRGNVVAPGMNGPNRQMSGMAGPSSMGGLRPGGAINGGIGTMAGGSMGVMNGSMDLSHPGAYNPSGEILAMLQSKGNIMGANMSGVNMGQVSSVGMPGLGGAEGGGTEESAPFDLNEFPALGGPGRGIGGSMAAAAAAAAAAAGGVPGVRGEGSPELSASRYMAMGSFGRDVDGNAHQGHGAGEFTIQDQDFPALPGAKASGGMGGHVEGGPMGTMGSSAPGSYTPGSGVLPDRWGMLGLLNVIRMTDHNLNMLALGTDLMTLGLNLNAPDSLHETFTSPWTETQQHKDDFSLPQCYLMNPPQLKELHLQKFTDATLFYIFYHLHRDSHYPRKQLLQIAAQELYNRGWRYYQESNLWVARAATGEMKYFDYQTWEHRPFVPEPLRAGSGTANREEEGK
mmetsp:Transcript_31956/g.75148  ORF Transcript_31956/g.75148 Transcript_31956/m.75148 type:complete len:494 (+) Transcript_31956:116-1597(+)